ncbi:MAG: DNA replication/repair protein RecF [Microbacteriaceae bacterium]|nr:DNA replication/repair protein RecF [Microbacteriaceae bacterium]
MRISKIDLTNFRNYENASLDLDPGFTVLLGKNGQGKTNLIESVVWASNASSHRVSGTDPLIRVGADEAVLRIQCRQGERALTIAAQLNRNKPTVVMIGSHPAKLKDLVAAITTVVFAPEDLALVKGDPADRRNYLDVLASKIFPNYLATLTDYERAIRQRNSLLKTIRGNSENQTLDIWTEKIISLGAKTIEYRLQLVKQLLPYLEQSYQNIAGDNHHAGISYVSDIADAGEFSRDDLPTLQEISDLLSRALTNKAAQEIERGVTLAGPHRDDVFLSINSLPAKTHSSHGESWSMAISLRLAAAKLLKDGPLGDPVLILDDVFAELDVSRRERLAEAIKDFEQVLITTADPEDVPNVLRGTIVEIETGRIK